MSLFTLFCTQFVLSWFAHFCVEKNLTKNYIYVEKKWQISAMCEATPPSCQCLIRSCGREYSRINNRKYFQPLNTVRNFGIITFWNPRLALNVLGDFEDIRNSVFGIWSRSSALVKDTDTDRVRKTQSQKSSRWKTPTKGWVWDWPLTSTL